MAPIEQSKMGGCGAGAILAMTSQLMIGLSDCRDPGAQECNYFGGRSGWRRGCLRLNRSRGRDGVLRLAIDVARLGGGGFITPWRQGHVSQPRYRCFG